MEKIILEFCVTPSHLPLNGVKVVMTFDETGKNYTVGYDERIAEIKNMLSEKQEELP